MMGQIIEKVMILLWLEEECPESAPPLQLPEKVLEQL